MLLSSRFLRRFKQRIELRYYYTRHRLCTIPRTCHLLYKTRSFSTLNESCGTSRLVYSGLVGSDLCSDNNQLLVGDKDLVKGVSDSIQAQEKLIFSIKKKLIEDDLNESVALHESTDILKSLRQLKASIEGTLFNFNPISLNESQLSELCHLVSTYPDGHVTKQELADKVTSLFKGQVKRLLFACILSCPWYTTATVNRTANEKSINGSSNNVLSVVYVSNDDHFFSLAPQHERDHYDRFNEPPLFAYEVRHFISLLQKGNIRATEILSTSSSSCQQTLLTSHDWDQLTSLINPQSLLNFSFVQGCMGWAFRSLVDKTKTKKKSKLNDELIIKDDVSLTTFCDSLRLLSYAQSAIDGQTSLQTCSNVVSEEESQLLELFTEEKFTKEHKDKLLTFILNKKEKMEEKVKELPKEPFKWSPELGEWLARTRMKRINVPLSDPTSSVSDPHRNFLDSQGLTSLHSRDLLMIAKAGSHMYNLATPTSDIDYIVIYKQPTEAMISNYRNLKGYMDNRGSHSNTETTAYECQMVCEMLMKGAANMFELLFATDLYYTTPHWSQLTVHKEHFITEQVILQYIGLIEANMKLIASRKHIHTPSREQKYFYNIFHKLLSLESYAEGGPPVVWCSEGKDRDFIMKIREGPLQDDLDRELLYNEVEERLSNVQHLLIERKERFNEYTNHSILQSWLLSVRGIGSQWM